MVPSHLSIDSGCDYWSSVHSPQKPCDLLQILLPFFLQAVNTDWSLKLKTIIVTLSFTSAPWVPLLFYFWGLRSGLQYIFSSLCSTVWIAFICLFLFFFFLMIWWLSVLLSISTLNQTLRSSQKRRWPPTKQALNCYW